MGGSWASWLALLTSIVNTVISLHSVDKVLNDKNSYILHILCTKCCVRADRVKVRGTKTKTKKNLFHCKGTAIVKVAASSDRGRLITRAFI